MNSSHRKERITQSTTLMSITYCPACSPSFLFHSIPFVFFSPASALLPFTCSLKAHHSPLFFHPWKTLEKSTSRLEIHFLPDPWNTVHPLSSPGTWYNVVAIDSQPIHRISFAQKWCVGMGEGLADTCIWLWHKAVKWDRYAVLDLITKKHSHNYLCR